MYLSDRSHISITLSSIRTVYNHFLILHQPLVTANPHPPKLMGFKAPLFTIHLVILAGLMVPAILLLMPMEVIGTITDISMVYQHIRPLRPHLCDGMKRQLRGDSAIG